MLTTRYADRNISFRNLGWSGDTPAGDSRFGLSLLQAGREPADEGWKQLLRQLEEARPTVVFAGYGMASSFDGDSGLSRFKTDYVRLLDELARLSPGTRLVFLGPIRHQALSSPWPNPSIHNVQLEQYNQAVRETASQRKAPFISLFNLLPRNTPSSGQFLSEDGIHLTDSGYRAAAEAIEDNLWQDSRAGAWRTSPHSEVLRQAILRKNEWFFHRSRPANMAYIFGFRKAEQGRNAAEVLLFDEAVRAEEQRIAILRRLHAANVPEIPLRLGNRVTKVTEQPHLNSKPPTELKSRYGPRTH
jgi:lysophospholipase L1-like esterase